MKWACWSLVGLVVATASVVMVRRSLSGQERKAPPFLALRQAGQPAPAEAPPVGGAAADPAPAAVSVGDALLRPLDLPFGEPTTLADVQKYLAGALGASVVLDLAALDRLDLDPEDTVQLDLKGVRLKTGLKLLLDQVELTYRVVAEDNLLILTDASEAGEPLDRALRQLKTIHDELHDLRDAVDDLRDLVEEDLGVEPEADPNRAVFVGSPPRPAPRAKVGPRRRREQPREGRTMPEPRTLGAMVGTAR